MARPNDVALLLPLAERELAELWRLVDEDTP
jgi:hypothetical protein